MHLLHAWEWFVNVVNGNHPWLPGNLVWAVITVVVVTLLWPRLRRAVDRWMKGHIDRAHAELHRKLDHIIRESPDIHALPPVEAYPVGMTTTPPDPIPGTNPNMVIPLPTWTDATSVAAYVTALAGAALTIVAIVKPGWHPSFNVQAVAVAVGAIVSAAAMLVNVIRHIIVTKALVASASVIVAAGHLVTMMHGKRKVVLTTAA